MLKKGNSKGTGELLLGEKREFARSKRREQAPWEEYEDTAMICREKENCKGESLART